MTESQSKLLNMLDFFHKLCVKENLRYYVVGGTALGTMRHGGFIPWDDDIDVGMPRPDYERLCQLAKTNLSSTYVFEFPGEAKDFTYTYAKMYDTSTTLVENKRHDIKRGLYIDVFPIDGMGDTYEAGLNHYKAIDKYKNLIGMKTYGIRKGRKLYKNLSVVLMRLVPEFVLSTRKLMDKFDSLCRAEAYDNSVYVANCSGAWGSKEVIEKRWLGTPIVRDFSSIKVMCPEYADEYLTALYGDWRTPPPIEKQKSHHDYVYIDLSKSYLN